MQKGITLIEICTSLVFLMLVIPCIMKQSQISFNFIKKTEVFLKSNKKDDYTCKKIPYKNLKILKCTNKKNEISYKIEQ